MRWLGLVLCLGACSSETLFDPPVTPAPPPPLRVVTAVDPIPRPVRLPDEAESLALASTSFMPVMSVPLELPDIEPPAHGLVAAGHDRPILTFAATDDGAVAVSVDDRGGMRLWPSLDGKHEPVMVRSQTAVDQLAIARDGDDVVIAAAEPLGQLEVIRTTGRGEPIAHTRVDLARTIVALRAVPSGFVGLRDDQVLVALDLHGVPRGNLTANPGERIAAITGRRGKLLAFVQIERRVHARWIELADKLAWGRQSPALAIEPTTAVLAPDLLRIAAASDDHKAIVIVDLEHGKRLERPVVDEVDLARRPLGFIDDQRLQAQVSHGATEWWYGQVWSAKRLHVHSGTVVATDRAILTASQGDLTLTTPAAVQHLGFDMMTISSAQLDGDRLTITDTRSTLQVGARLREQRLFPIARDGYELTLLDGQHAVLRTSAGLFAIALAHPDDRTPLCALYGESKYEPSTHLLAVADYDKVWFGHYSPAKHAFDKTVLVNGPNSVVLLEPAANHGNVAVVVEQTEQTTITEVRSIDFSVPTPLRASRSYHSEAVFEGNGMGPGPDPALLLGLTDTVKQRPNPDGSLIAEVGHHQITLRNRAGTVAWSITRPGITDVVWRSSSELMAFGSGMATIDLATGALLDRQCGWEFGLWDDEGGATSGAMLCEAP